MAARLKAWVCGRSLAGNVGSFCYLLSNRKVVCREYSLLNESESSERVLAECLYVKFCFVLCLLSLVFVVKFNFVK